MVVSLVSAILMIVLMVKAHKRLAAVGKLLPIFTSILPIINIKYHNLYRQERNYNSVRGILFSIAFASIDGHWIPCKRKHSYPGTHEIAKIFIIR
jgi:hypothetical protein